MIIAVGDTCAFGGVTLGQTDGFGVEAYFLGIDGRGAPGSTVQAQQKAAGDGGFASPAFLQPRTFTVTGALVAPTRAALIDAFDRVQAAASIDAQNVTVTVAGGARYVIAQRQGETLVTDETDVYMTFSVTFLAVKPRWLAAGIVKTTNLPQSTGGLTVPFTVPFTISSTVVAGSCAATNLGNRAGPVVLRIDGPVTSPVVTHVGAGVAVALAVNYAVPAGNWLTVDMDAHTVLENDQADRERYVTSRGWSGFDPGLNTWSWSASAPSPSALLTVTATPAWL